MLKYLADGTYVAEIMYKKIWGVFLKIDLNKNMPLELVPRDCQTAACQCCVPDDMFLGLQRLVKASYLAAELLLLQLYAPHKLILSIQCSSQLLPFLT